MDVHCLVWGSHIGFAEGSGVVGCNALWFQTFWRSWGRHLEPLRMKVPWFMKCHELIMWMTQCHIPADLNPQHRCCENIKPCILLLLFACSWMFPLFGTAYQAKSVQNCLLLLTGLCGFVAILQGRIWWPCFYALGGCTSWMTVYAILLKAFY